jgi:phenylalanyl-tRNA synthetase beta chain
MKYSYNWLKEFVPGIPAPAKLVELLTMRAFEVEGIEAAGPARQQPELQAMAGGKDTVLDIKVLPNRAFDCLSHIGMAREAAAIANLKFKISSFKLNEDKSSGVKDFLKVEVKDKKLCPRYSARLVVDVKVGESPQWMKDRLIACGSRPINNIVDATNYVMLMTGQPLHAFDFDKISGLENPKPNVQNSNKSQISNLKSQIKKIIVRRAKKDEKIITLEGEERELDENILVIADSMDPIAIAGIKGGKKAEIDSKTTRIILESANFDPALTRKSSKILNLRTDASIRFENGVDIDLTMEAVNRVAALVAELAGGKIATGAADTGLTKPKRISTAASHSYIESLLGIKIKSSEVSNILKRLSLPLKIVKKKGDVFYEVMVPAWRNDLNTSEDLIEEIGRLYGYESIPARMPTSVLVPAVKNEELINEEKARNIMIGAGYSEVYNYSLVSEKDKELFGFEMAGPKYPLSNDQKYLRPTLVIRLLENVKENLKYFNSVRIFEIGKVFRVKEKNIQEKRMIGGVLCGNAAGGKNIFYEAKGLVDLLLEKMGVPDFEYNEYIKNDGVCKKAEIFDPVKRVKVIAGGKEIGWVGKISKNILSEMEIKEPIAVFELNFDFINELIEEEIEYQAPSKYPAIERDLSVIASREVKVDDVLNVIENASGPMAVEVALEDVYEGEHLEESVKSLTFKFVFQSFEKTLTDAEVNKIMEKVITAVEGEGWEIRK